MNILSIRLKICFFQSSVDFFCDIQLLRYLTVLAKPKGKTKWTKEESDLVLNAFHKYLTTDRLPGKKECLMLITKNKELRNRSWTNVKDFVRNHKTSLRRKKKKVE